MHTIYQWAEVQDDFSETILVGNGASISINDSFTYKSLKEYAQEHGFFNEDVNSLFEQL